MNMIDGLQFDWQLLPHTANLARKQRIAEPGSQLNLVLEVAGRYDKFLAQIDYRDICAGDYAHAVAALNGYLVYAKGVEKADRFFNWRSGFGSSVIPEFIYRCLLVTLRDRSIAPLFSGRRSVVDLSLSGQRAGGWQVRHKNQDLAVGLREDKVETATGTDSFVVPVAVFEVKTNIDANKLHGLDFSAERLKRTFPAAQYLLVTETVDFSLKDNYASGSIDEIYVLRKQIRGEVRRQPTPLKPDVFSQLAGDVVDLMVSADLDRGHVYDRLTGGKLIHV